MSSLSLASAAYRRLTGYSQRPRSNNGKKMGIDHLLELSRWQNSSAAANALSVGTHPRTTRRNHETCGVGKATHQPASALVSHIQSCCSYSSSKSCYVAPFRPSTHVMPSSSHSVTPKASSGNRDISLSGNADSSEPSSLHSLKDTLLFLLLPRSFSLYSLLKCVLLLPIILYCLRLLAVFVTSSLLLNPSLFLSLTHFLAIWPWPMAIALGIWSLVTLSLSLSSSPSPSPPSLLSRTEHSHAPNSTSTASAAAAASEPSRIQTLSPDSNTSSSDSDSASADPSSSPSSSSSSRRPPVSVWSQLALLSTALIWLLLAPCAVFQGYVDSWRFTLFVLYGLFFSLSSVVRARNFGPLSAKQGDRQWATTTSRAAQVLFVISVVSAHWLAAFEGSLPPPSSPPFLSTLSSLSSRFLSPILLTLAFWLHADAAFFLGKYFDRLVTPSQIVTVGPYRLIRHPLYASYMLLFASMCLSLHGPLSLLLILSSSLAYYHHRMAVEEELLLAHFPTEYTTYQARTPFRLLPFIY